MVGPKKDLESRFARACYGSGKEGFGDCPEKDGGGGMRDECLFINYPKMDHTKGQKHRVPTVAIRDGNIP